MVAIVVLFSMPVIVAALQRWWDDIAGPLQSRDDGERIIAKGSVLVIFVACLLYAGLGLLASALQGKVGLAVFAGVIGFWLWQGVSEVERCYHLLEAVQRWKG
ncbi:MAG: hypothetical protein HGA45_26860 [Chloroflexales bacterium]|nr:hypothetical protein [Chloroflexales bacterium]